MNVRLVCVFASSSCIGTEPAASVTENVESENTDFRAVSGLGIVFRYREAVFRCGFIPPFSCPDYSRASALDLFSNRLQLDILDNRRLCAEGAETLSWRPLLLLEAKNGRFRAILSHKMAQIVPKDLKPFVIFNPNKLNNVIIITLENYWNPTQIFYSHLFWVKNYFVWEN